MPVRGAETAADTTDGARGRPAFTALLFLVAFIIASTAPTIVGAAAAHGSVQVDHAGTVQPGHVLTVRVVAPRVESGEVSLSLPDGRVVATRIWRAAGKPGREQVVGVALLGVPSTTEVGAAMLDLTLSGPHDEKIARRSSLLVTRRSFRSERIALNSAMSDLRTSDDPRRAEQSRVLWELLQGWDGEGRYHTGSFLRPVDAVRRTSFFGDRRLFAYTDGESDRSIHNGLDIAAPTGTPIVAPGSGRVVMATDRIITGLSVVLEHLPGVYSIYYHLDSLAVEEGRRVVAGEPLGTVGSTGLSTGPHLHWELRVAGVAVDPEPYLRAPLVDMTGAVGSLSVVP